MASTVAKDIFRVDFSKLIRFWVRDRPDPTKNPKWVELGHFFAGFDYKLVRIREIDGSKRENAVATCYEAQGSFRVAQNAIVDYQNNQSLLKGPLEVTMLVGRTWEPTHGTIIQHVWAKTASGDYVDNRIALVADPDYNAQMAASGTISGFVTEYERYLVKNITFANGTLNWQLLDSMNSLSVINTGTHITGQ
jgi:hypothetical protein